MLDTIVAARSAVLNRATSRLRQAGIVEARREALQLAEVVWQLGPAELLDHQGTPVAAMDSESFEALIERRVAGEPLVYVLGSTGFRYLTLGCDSRALIPRPETEMLVELVLQRVSTGVAIDVGTGTGCIALSLEREGTFDRVLAVDRYRGTLALARENADRCGATIDFIRGDLAGMLGSGSVDALVSNPPYLTKEEHRLLDASVADWEPAEALASGDDGMEATRQLVTQGLSALRPGGWLALEVDAARARQVSEFARERGFDRVEVIKDLFERERYVLAQKESLT